VSGPSDNSSIFEELSIAQKDGCTPLFVDCENGQAEIVSALIAAKAGIDIANKDGWTPLFVASSEGHRRSARVNIRDKDGATPLYARS